MRVVLVDDHEFFRVGLRRLLTEHAGIEVVGEAGDGVDALELCRLRQPDVVVMDLNMPRMNGVAATRELRHTAPDAKVLVLTVNSEDMMVVEAVRHGAFGYLLKDAPGDEIARGIRAVARGELLTSSGVARALVGAAAGAAARARSRDVVAEALTPRELDVLRLVAAGRGNAEIAKELYLSSSTVKSHIARILEKLGVENRVEAAAHAARAGIA